MYTITNKQTGWKKENMTDSQVREFCFNKLNKNAFSPTALVDYDIIVDGQRTPLSNFSLTTV